MSNDILIWDGKLLSIQRTPPDVTGVPLEASLICEPDWKALCQAAGSEAALIATLGVKDEREAS